MWISKKQFGGFFFIFEKNSKKIPKKITKVLETIKLNKKLMLGIWLKNSKLRVLFKGLFKWY